MKIMEQDNKDVWVFIEQRNGKPADVSFELLSKGKTRIRPSHRL